MALAATSLSVLVGFVGAIGAQEAEGPYGMKVGSGSRLILSLDVKTRYESNVYFQENNEDSAIGLIVSPSALLLTDRGALRHEIAVSAEAGAKNTEGDADDYVDGLLSGNFEWAPLTRHRFRGGAFWRFDHDPFGTRRTEDPALVNRSIDRWEQKGANVVYLLGAPEATLNFEFEGGAYDREYTTNRSQTQFLDHDVTWLRGTGVYRISSKTGLLAEVIGSDIDYDQTAPGFASRSGNVTRYRVGARWAATGKTVGEVKIGRVERDFDSSLQAGYDEMDWQIKVTWEPRARDRVHFVTGREPEESYVNSARIIDDQFYEVGWRHDWTGLFRSILTYEFHDLDFQGNGRADEVQSLSLDLQYKPTRRWAVFADLTLRDRESNEVGRDFDNTILTTGIRLTY